MSEEQKKQEEKKEEKPKTFWNEFGRGCCIITFTSIVIIVCLMIYLIAG